jgi:hypothetical protein
VVNCGLVNDIIANILSTFTYIYYIHCCYYNCKYVLLPYVVIDLDHPATLLLMRGAVLAGPSACLAKMLCY